MRFNKKRSIVMLLSFFTALSASTLLQSCKDEDESMKSVDLRYRVEDSYLREAKNPETISFVVKSTDPWEVFGAKRETWYTISPDKGDAGEKYTVGITLQENTNLDDRTDTIHIKSDYWTGKKFLLTQKGIAFLRTENVELIDQEGGASSFDVLSNQKWSAKVTEGGIWLSIEAGSSGELNQKITLKATANKGEQRTGIVTIYDRHGKVAQTVECTQNGVLLSPKAPENGKWFVLYEQAQQLTIPVESNAEWILTKENEADDDWFTFEETSFNGSGNIVINVAEHKGSSVRTGVIILTSKAAEGATPVVKTVKFKQANPKVPKVTEVNKAVSGDLYGPGGLMPGRYSFYYAPFTASQINLFFIWSASNPYAEIRFHVRDKNTMLSTTPWCSDVYEGVGKKTLDTSKPNVLSFEIQEVADKKDPAKRWIYTEWILNGEVIAKATSDGVSDGNGTDDTWKVPFEQISAGGNFLIRVPSGSVTVTRWEYVAPLVWGD